MVKARSLSVHHFASDVLEHIINDDRILELASEYQTKYSDKTEAAKHFIKDCSKQANCIAAIEQFASFANIPELAGASIGFLGLVGYQMHIVCGIAAIAGENVHSNEVKTQCVECLAVNAAARALRTVAAKAAGVILEKYNLKGVEKVVDGIAEFVLDWGAIKIVGKRAYKTFFDKFRENSIHKSNSSAKQSAEHTYHLENASQDKACPTNDADKD